MDCQQLIIYGILLLVGLYVLKDVCGIKLPFLDTKEGFLGFGSDESVGSGDQVGAPSQAPAVQAAAQGVVASSESLGSNEINMPVSGIKTEVTSCYPQNTLGPGDLLPSGESKQIQDFNNTYPVGEGILKGVNFLDAGFHVGVNTIGQSLRNANLNLRAEPQNPQVKVSPWMNSTIAPDLSRKSLDDETVCNARPQGGALNGFDGNGSVPGSA
jgi:hypothetical protein